MRLYGADITGSLQTTGSISLSGSFKDQESSSGTAGQVLSSTVSGSQWVDASSGDVIKTGTIVANQIAIWNNTTNQLRSDPTFVIDSDHKITLYQPNSSNNDRSSYNIGGGNIDNVTGQFNTGFGKNNLTSIVAGSQNIAIGANALSTNTDGDFNIAVGYNSLLSLTTGASNTAYGNQTLQANTYASQNSAFGTNALILNVSGASNTALGYLSLGANTSGPNNVAVGALALRNSTGTTNTAIGHSAGSAITTGDKNVIIGTNTGSTIATSDNNIIISDGSGNNRIQVDSGGDATFSGDVTITQPTNGSDAILNLTAKSSSGNSRTSSLTYDADTENLIVNNAGTNALTISSGGIVGIGSTGIFAGTNAILNLQGSGIALKNDRNGSNNNWSYIQNDGTGNESTIILSTGNAVPAMKLAHNGDVSIGTTSPEELLDVYTEGTDPTSILQIRANRTGYGNIRTNLKTYAGGSSATDKFTINFEGTDALTISSGGDATFSGNVEVKNETAASFARLTIDNTIDNYNSEISFKSIYGGTTAKEFRIGSNIGVGSGSWEVYDVTASETRFSISSGGDVNIGSSDGLPLMHGSVAANASYCTYSFVNDPDTGMIRTGANTLALVTAGSSRLTISSTGKVGVGVSPDTNSKLTIKGSGDSGTSNSIAVYNFANSSIFTVRDDGHITMNTLTNGPYSNGVSGRDLIINSAGQLGTSVSIRKAKINIENEIDVSWLYNLNPVKFNYRKKDKKFNYLNEAEEEQKHGLIAEEVEKINTDFCWYNVNEEGDKTLAGVDYKMLITPMLKAIQEQQAIIEELKSRIETLEG